MDSQKKLQNPQESVPYSDTSFSTSGSLVQDIISFMPNPANVKDANTHKYILSNEHILGTYGLKNIDEFIGRTIIDLGNMMKESWDENFALNLDKTDKEVISKKQTRSIYPCIYIDKQGLIRATRLTKHPVVGLTNKAVGVLTLTFDYTHNINLIKLLRMYKNSYIKNNKTTKYFLKHLGIYDNFNQDLTLKETICLLHMRENQSYKSIANAMNVSLKTIESHIAHITNKIPNSNLNNILAVLRSDLVAQHKN